MILTNDLFAIKIGVSDVSLPSIPLCIFSYLLLINNNSYFTFKIKKFVVANFVYFVFCQGSGFVGFAQTINTSFTVMLTLGALIIFGGPLLRQFYYTLLAGTAIGVYSTLFNATPMVILWDRIGESRRSRGRRTAVEERPMVEISPSNGGGSKSDVESAAEQTPDTTRTARPRRKKKRF